MRHTELVSACMSCVLLLALVMTAGNSVSLQAAPPLQATAVAPTGTLQSELATPVLVAPDPQADGQAGSQVAGSSVQFDPNVEVWITFGVLAALLLGAAAMVAVRRGY